MLFLPGTVEDGAASSILELLSARLAQLVFLGHGDGVEDEVVVRFCWDLNSLRRRLKTARMPRSSTTSHLSRSLIVRSSKGVNC